AGGVSRRSRAAPMAHARARAHRVPGPASAHLLAGGPAARARPAPVSRCLGLGQRARAGRLFNDLVASGAVSAPIVIGRDHLDCGSVASPNRETEAMLGGSAPTAHWPALHPLGYT